MIGPFPDSQQQLCTWCYIDPKGLRNNLHDKCEKLDQKMRYKAEAEFFDLTCRLFSTNGAWIEAKQVHSLWTNL